MSTIVFSTPGLIDLRSFTIMGMSAKPNSENPIGYFGTGLKYAMAVMVRLGAEPRVWIGKDQHVFVRKQINFRGAEFSQLGLRSLRWGLARWRTTTLPFTTEHGKNWKAWMAFRELEANTRDEGGETLAYPGRASDVNGIEGRTLIAIEHPEFAQAHAGMDEIFLDGGMQVGDGVQILTNRASQNIYYRGLNVYKTRKPCINTYNVLDHLELTEDRTLKYEFMAQGAIGREVAKSQDEDMIERFVSARDEHWESGIVAGDYVQPSDAFLRVMARTKRATGLWRSYHAAHVPPSSDGPYRLFRVHPLPWRVDGNVILDANGSMMFARPSGYLGNWSMLAQSIVEMGDADQ